jgi:hypothetical protein
MASKAAEMAAQATAQQSGAGEASKVCDWFARTTSLHHK